MSHATMSPFVAQQYSRQMQYYDNFTQEQLEKHFRQGMFIHSSMHGSYEKTCFIVFESEGEDYFDIRFFDENICEFVNRRVPRIDVTFAERDIGYYVVKNIKNGGYHKASSTSSSCPTIYSSKGVAEARRKQKNKPEDWVVKKWEITEVDV